jgi:parallel beta-helix repeat protein
MKGFLSIIALLIVVPVHSSTKYYLSATGNDKANGISEKTPWKTISKLNSESGKIKPGDMILFKRGDVFYGSVNVLKSGVPAKPILFGAYGSGSDPEITGFITINGWQNSGNGVFSKEVSCESPASIVTVNGVNTPKGCWPDNGGFKTIRTHKGNNQIYDADLKSMPDWTGGEIVFRPYPWVINTFPIIKHSGSELIYKGAGDEPRDGYGYFIQNHPSALNQTGEWSFDNNFLKMFFGTEDPGKFIVRVGTLNYLFKINGRNYITIENLKFTGAITGAIDLTASSNIVIQKCKIEFSGTNAISTNYGGPSQNIKISENKISNSNSSFIKILDQFSFVTINNNQIENTGLLIGMGATNLPGAYTAVYCDAPDCFIENNRIINTGYNGIVFSSKAKNAAIQNNYVNRFCLVADDGGGIYTWIGASGKGSTGQVIRNNIVINAVGSAELGDNEMQANGIYIDDGAENIIIEGNTVANCSGTGIFIHNAHEISILKNTVFNCSKAGQISFVQDHHAPEDLIRNIDMRDNIFCADSSGQKALTYITTADDIALFGKADNNCYVKPFGDSGLIVTQINAWRGRLAKRTLSEWQEYSGQDLNSRVFPGCTHNLKGLLSKGYYKLEPVSGSPKEKYNYIDLNSARLIVNDTHSEKAFSLTEPHIDVRGTKHFNKIKLGPFTSTIIYRLYSDKTN